MGPNVRGSVTIYIGIKGMYIFECLPNIKKIPNA